MKRCVVFGSVEIDFPAEKMIKDTDMVIAADRGWQNAIAHGVKPDYIVGDFDSSPMPENLDADITVLPVVKDDTDTHHVARFIIENGYTDVLMLGMLGGKRMEHTFANIQTMLWLSKNRVNATAVDKYSQVMVITDGTVRLPDMGDKFFSLFTLGDKREGVSIKGAKYSLDNYTMTNDFPIGVSNEFIGEDVEITVAHGEVLLVITKKD